MKSIDFIKDNLGFFLGFFLLVGVGLYQRNELLYSKKGIQEQLNVTRGEDNTQDQLVRKESELDQLLVSATHELANYRDLENKLKENASLREHIPSIVPVSGILTSSFGMRTDPITARRNFHPAIDIAAPPGTPVFAPASGVVRKSTFEEGYGLTLELDHGDFLTRYAHLSRLTCKTGNRIKRGEIIGFVGASGKTTGSHLHYEVYKDKNPVNPLQYIIPREIFYE